jgi:hypothetical protein
MVKFFIGAALVFSATMASAQLDGIPSNIGGDLSEMQRLQEELVKNDSSVSSYAGTVLEVNHIKGKQFEVITKKCSFKATKGLFSDDVSIVAGSKTCNK